MAKTILILGGSFAGLHVAHYLLKKHDKDIKVILVSKNSHFYWNIASVRAIIPGILKDEQIFSPLQDALKRYPKDSYELIIGAAESADFDAKTVQVSTASGPKTLSYDQLVLATGSRCPETDAPWKAAGTYEEVVESLHKTAERAKAASHIAVAGGGATGVELAGELGYEYGKTKEIVLLNAGSALMNGDIAAGNAASELKKLNVKIKTGAKVTGTKTLADGKTEIALANGETITTDLYLPTMGLIPNTEYVPAKYLNENKSLIVDDYLRVTGAKDVWAAGDTVSKPRAGFMITQKQAAGVGKNIELALKGKEPLVVKGMPIDILACAVGRGRGAGRMGSMKMLSFMVWMAKGRTLGLQMMPGYVDGSVA